MMKTIEELDHYEVLEVAREARRDDIERAFALVRAAYDGEALAAYSVLSPDEAKVWRERIEDAWRVLSDPDQRRAYDATLDGAEAYGDDADPFASSSGGSGGSGELGEVGAYGDHATFGGEPAPLPEAPNSLPSFAGDAGWDRREPHDRPLAVEEPPMPERVAPRELESFEESDVDAPWDGPRLRRARLARGLEIEDVAGITKVNPTYLRFLEDERFDDLPAVVYVRGFVVAYARLLGLDPSRVAPSYVLRCEEHRGQQARGRAHGRR